MNKLPNKIFSLIILQSVLMTSPLLAAEQPAYEDAKKPRGIAAPLGMVLGLVAGGPFGLLVATGMGAIIDEQRLEKYETQLQLTQVQQQQSEQEAQYLIASREWNDKYQSGFERSLSYTLQFRTGSSELEAHYSEQLSGLAHLLKKMPHLSIRLAGHADQLGEEGSNQSLSRARVDQVENFLVNQGVEAQRIQSYAYGEGMPLSPRTSIEDNPFERRVNIIVSNSLHAVVSN